MLALPLSNPFQFHNRENTLVCDISHFWWGWYKKILRMYPQYSLGGLETYLYALKVILVAVVVVHEPAPGLNYVLHALPSELLLVGTWLLQAPFSCCLFLVTIAAVMEMDRIYNYYTHTHTPSHTHRHSKHASCISMQFKHTKNCLLFSGCGSPKGPYTASRTCVHTGWDMRSIIRSISSRPQNTYIFTSNLITAFCLLNRNTVPIKARYNTCPLFQQLSAHLHLGHGLVWPRIHFSLWKSLRSTVLSTIPNMGGQLETLWTLKFSYQLPSC